MLNIICLAVFVALALFTFLPLWVGYAARVLCWLYEHCPLLFARVLDALGRAGDVIARWWDWLDRIKNSETE